MDGVERYPLCIGGVRGRLDLQVSCHKGKSQIKVTVFGFLFSGRDGMDVHIEESACERSRIVDSCLLFQLSAGGCQGAGVGRVHVAPWL